MNRICPSEEVLSEYLCGILKGKDRELVEEHAASCRECRVLLFQTYDVLRHSRSNPKLKQIIAYTVQNIWFVAALVALVLSFFMHKYFLQFLTASVLFALKWIMDSRTAKILIAVHESMKERKSVGREEVSPKTRKKFSDIG